MIFHIWNSKEKIKEKTNEFKIQKLFIFRSNCSSSRRISTEKSLANQNKLRKQKLYLKTTLIMMKMKITSNPNFR